MQNSIYERVSRNRNMEEDGRHVKDVSEREQVMKDNVNLLWERHAFNCPNHLAICNNMDCVAPVFSHINVKHPDWCIRVKCTNCSKTWNVCRTCAPGGMQSSRMITNKCIAKHNDRRHANGKSEREPGNSTNLSQQKRPMLEDDHGTGSPPAKKANMILRTFSRPKILLPIT